MPEKEKPSTPDGIGHLPMLYAPQTGYRGLHMELGATVRIG